MERRERDVSTEDTSQGKPKAKAGPEAKASGSGPADPNKIAPSLEKTLDEWLEFVNTSLCKLNELEEEVSELGGSIAPMANEKLVLQESLLLDVKNVITKKLVAMTMGDTGEFNDLSDFHAFLLAFQRGFNRNLVYIQNLVNATKAVSGSFTLGLVLEAAGIAKAGNNS